jgi:hypothetical protein
MRWKSSAPCSNSWAEATVYRWLCARPRLRPVYPAGEQLLTAQEEGLVARHALRLVDRPCVCVAEVTRGDVLAWDLDAAAAVDVDEETAVAGPADDAGVAVQEPEVIAVAVRQNPVAEGEDDVVDGHHVGPEASLLHEGLTAR